jgi:hypothetical protein
LLTSPVEQTALSALLLGHNPQLTICPAATSEDLAALNPSALSCSRLIAFSSPVIVPRGVLGSLGYGAYNFHPGPPQFPGWAPAHFALYEHASEFGATAHAMDERVDSGPIVDVALFPPISACSDSSGSPTRIWHACSGSCRSGLRPRLSPCPYAKRGGAKRRTRGAPIRRSAIFRSISAARVRSSHAHFRRQSFWNVADHSPPRRGVSRSQLRPARSSASHDRQLLEGAQARASAPPDLRRIDCELKARPAHE